MGVDQQVHTDLAQTGRIAQDPWQVRLQVGDHIDLAITRLVPQQLEDLLEDDVHIHHGNGAVRLPAEAEQMVDDPLAAVGLPDDHLQIVGKDIQPAILLQVRFVAEPPQQRLGAAGHRGERVVDLVGDAGSQHADTGHLFGLDQVHFLQPFFGDVSEKHQCPVFLPQGILDRRGGDVHVLGPLALTHRNVRCLHPLAPERSLHRASVGHGRRFRMEHLPAGTAWPDLPGVELRSDEIVVLDQAVVVVHRDAVADGIENRLQFVGLVAQLDLGSLALGDVLGRPVEPHHIAGTVDRRLDDGIDPPGCAVAEQQAMLDLVAFAMLDAQPQVLHD